MKAQNKYLVYCLMLLVGLASCDKEEGNFPDSPYETKLFNISIVNAGVNGDMTVNGTVNEDTKRISFPTLVEGSSLNGVKFDAKMSEGAQLDSASYTFVNNETRVIKVVNNTRVKEYLISLKNITIWGADFTSPTTYDFINPKYPDFTGNLTRSSDFDGEHVLIVTRSEGNRPHLLKRSDLQEGKIDNPLMLSTKNVAGGTYAISSGRLAQGHIYICNLTTNPTASPLKLYHWASPTADPVEVFSFNGDALRYGDNMSLDLDEQGNGYVYFGDNAGNKIVRATINNFTTVSEPKVFAAPSNTTFQTSVNKVNGIANEYIMTGYATPIYLTDANGVVLYKMTNTEIPQTACNARVINFNKERYLIFSTFRRTADLPSTSLFVYNITQGATTQEALEYFDNNPKPALYSFDLNGTNIANPGCDIGWGVQDDELYIYSANASSGFVIAKFPKNN